MQHANQSADCFERQALLSAVHCDAGDTTVWPESMHHMMHFMGYAFLGHPACAKECWKNRSKQINQQVVLPNRHMLLSAVHCNARDTAVWPESMHPLICFARYAFFGHTAREECLNPCSKQINQQIALHSRGFAVSAMQCWKLCLVA